MPDISFDHDKLQRLRKAHAEAVDKGVDMFVFEGHQWLVSYAGYMIEYLASVLERKPL